MIKSVFLFFFWLDTIYSGNAVVAVAQNLVTLLPMVEQCVVTPPSGWVPYTVRSTNALAELANRTGVTVEALVTINCLSTPEVTAPLLLVAPKPLAPITPTSAPVTEATLPATIAITIVTPSPIPSAVSSASLSATLALSGSLLLLPTPEPATVTDAGPTFWSINGIGGISALILLVLLVLRDSMRNLQGRWQRFYLLLNRLLLPLLLLFLLLVVIRLFGVL